MALLPMLSGSSGSLGTLMKAMSCLLSMKTTVPGQVRPRESLYHRGGYAGNPRVRW